MHVCELSHSPCITSFLCRLESDNKQLRLLKLRMEQQLAGAGSPGPAPPVGRGLPGSACDNSPSSWRYQDTPRKAGRSPHKPARLQHQQEQEQQREVLEPARNVPRSSGLRSDAGPASQPLPLTLARHSSSSSRPSRRTTDPEPARSAPLTAAAPSLAAPGALPGPSKARTRSGEVPVVVAEGPGSVAPAAEGAAGGGGSRRVTGTKPAALELAGKIAQQVAPSSSVHSTIDALIHEIEMQCQRQERMKAQQKVLLGMIAGGVPPPAPGPT